MENSTSEINKLISQRWLKNFMEPGRKQRTREAQNEKSKISKLRVRLLRVRNFLCKLSSPLKIAAGFQQDPQKVFAQRVC